MAGQLVKLLAAAVTLAIITEPACAAHQPKSYRDPAEVRAFRQGSPAHPCPSTKRTTGACPGWVVDHIKALCVGGPDRPDNMQWQTTADAKAKDKWECKPARAVR